MSFVVGRLNYFFDKKNDYADIFNIFFLQNLFHINYEEFPLLLVLGNMSALVSRSKVPCTVTRKMALP